MSLSKRDNRLGNARDISLNTRISGLVGRRDKLDFYQLDLSQTSDFSLSFNRLKGRASAQVKLLNSSGGVVSNFKLSNRPITIQNTLEAGTYYIRVAAKGKSNRIRYRFSTAAAIAEPGETAATSRNIGVLNGTYTNQDLVGADDRLDYYKFSLDQISSFTASLGQLSQNVYMNLFYDSNGDGLFEESEIANATGTSTNDAFISDTLPEGNYLIEIRSSTSPTNTRYELVVSPT